MNNPFEEHSFPPKKIKPGGFFTSHEPARRFLLRLLNEQLIPRILNQGNLPVVLAEPAYIERHKFQVNFHRGKVLQEKELMHSGLLVQKWPKQGVHSSRYPRLLAVARGEVDWRIGITESVAQQLGNEWKECDYVVMNMPEGTFFLIPPHSPYPDGNTPHHESSHELNEQSVLFWLLIFPSGILAHFCRSNATTHESCAPEFVPCPQILPLINMLQTELEAGATGDATIIKTVLRAILEYTRRGLQVRASVRQVIGNTSVHEHDVEPIDQSQDPLQRAREYIEANLAASLKTSDIASHTFFSARQLDRYFRRYLNTSIMDYVISRRVEMAKVLLRETDLPVREVGQMVGYNNPSSFNQMFNKRMQMTPLSYRKLHKQ